MAVVVELEYRRRNIESPVAVPIRIDGEARTASALIHRIRSIDMSQRGLTPTGTAYTDSTQEAIGRLIQMIEG